MRPVRAGSFVTLLGDVKERAACAVDRVVASGVPREWTAGASARREHERRKSRREHAVRDKHPRIGALLLALREPPAHERRWAHGVAGEEIRLTASGLSDVRHDRGGAPPRRRVSALERCAGPQRGYPRTHRVRRASRHAEGPRLPRP
jgi:hypothetical protein